MKNNIHSNIHILKEYAKQYNVEEYHLIDELENILSDFFQKQVYFSQGLVPRFVQNERKVSINEKLYKLIFKKLQDFIQNKNTINKRYLNKKVNSIVTAKITRISINGYFAITNFDEECFLPKIKSMDFIFNAGEKFTFFCEKVNNNILILAINKKSIQKVLNETILNQNIWVEKWVKNKLFVFQHEHKLEKIEIEKIKLIIGGNTKIIFKKRIKKDGK